MIIDVRCEVVCQLQQNCNESTEGLMEQVVSQHRVEVLKVCVAIIITCVIILAVITGLLNLADCINTRYNQNLT